MSRLSSCVLLVMGAAAGRHTASVHAIPSQLVLGGGRGGNSAPKLGTTNPHYASWTIDASYNRGFVHIDFDNANLLAGATSLAPSTTGLDVVWSSFRR